MVQHDLRVTFGSLIRNYSRLLRQVVSQIRNIASRLSAATPGKFLLAQFTMAHVTQAGDSISNLIAAINSMINGSVRNQKAG